MPQPRRRRSLQRVQSPGPRRPLTSCQRSTRRSSRRSGPRPGRRKPKRRTATTRTRRARARAAAAAARAAPNRIPWTAGPMAEAAEAAASRKRPILGGGSAAGERRAVPLGMCRWHVYRGMKHILSLHALDAAQWGPPLHEDPLTLGDPDRDSAAGGDDDGRGAKRCKAGAGVRAMALTFEVSSEAVRKALPVPFERKAWINPK
mmetsp:Transcript_37506/g.116559  ORF Transcript_37506/g.116559 Transcript_37506/m.116559 type:complete len:204 (-) Transcript_37506:345-956(-)